MATLTGTLIKDTYDGLLKTTDNQALPLSGVEVIQDGLGNSSSLSLGQAGNGAEIGGNLSISGWADIDGDLNIDGGDLTTNLTSFNLLNSGVTTINAFGQATTVNMGIGTTNFNMSGSITTGSLNVADAIIHDGDTDTKIEFLANQIKTTTGGVLNINVVPTATTFYQNVFFDGNIYSTDGNISLTNGDIVTGGHIAINSGNAATSFSSNANNLIVGGADSGTNQGMTIASDSGATGNIFFADGITGDQQYRGLITYNHSSDTMYLGTAGANRISIASDGTFTKLGSTGNITLNDGGYKIDFSQQGIIEASGVGAYLNLIADGVMGLYASQLSFSRDSGITTDFNIDSSGVVNVANLTASNAITSGTLNVADAIIHTGDTDTMIEFLANQIKTTTGGVLNINTTSTATTFYQDVGIGATPRGTLDLTGDGIYLGYSSADANERDWLISTNYAAYGDFVIRQSNAKDGNPYSAGTTRLTIDSSGNVLIGGQNSNSKLTIEGARNEAIITLRSTSNDSSWVTGDRIGGIDFYSEDASGAGAGIKASISYQSVSSTSATNAMVFKVANTSAGTNNVEAMRIDNAGNVGIGDSPDTLLHIKGSAPSFKIESSDTSGSLNIPAGSINFFGGYSDSIEIASIRSIDASSGGVAGQLAFYTSEDPDTPTERMRIDSSGNVGIGGIPIGTGASGSAKTLEVSHSNVAALSVNYTGAPTGKKYDIVADILGFAIWDDSNSAYRMRIDSSGNVGIGNDSPSAVSSNATTLHIKSQATTKGGAIRLDSSDESIKTYMYPNSGDGFRIATSTSHPISFFTANTERMRIDSSGNVGINCTPSEIFQVDKKSSGVIAHLEGNSSYHMTIGEDSGNMYINANNGNATIEFRTNTTERMRIDSSGRVLVAGNATPSLTNAKFFISRGDQYGLGMWVSGGVANIISSDDNLAFGTQGSERMRIDSSGRVGISAGGSVRIASNSGTDDVMLEYYYSDTYKHQIIANQDRELSLRSTAGDGNGKITFYTQGTERMRIDSSGNVLIGNDSSSAIAGGGEDGTYIGVNGSIFTGKDSTSARTHYNFYNPNGKVGSITTSGSATAYNTSSDYRLKEDWQPMSGALDRVDALKPVNFAWKANGERVDGFLAHELAEVIPEAVTGEKDATEEYEVTPAEYKTVVITPAQEAVYETIEHPAIAEELDADGNIIVEAQEAWTEQVLVSEAVEEVTEQVLVSEAVMGTRPVYQGIDQSKIVPLLTAALQEAHELIKSLEARIQILENK